MLLVDSQIRELCLGNSVRVGRDVDFVYGKSVDIANIHNRERMIDPFSESVHGEGIVSYGLDHAGYCLRLSPTYWVMKNSHSSVVDPRKMKDEDYLNKIFDRIEASGDEIHLPPHSYILGCSHERLSIPDTIKGRCVGKSTLARCGIIINTTPLEPGWKGNLTIEIANTSPCPVSIPVMEGICQVEFELLSCRPHTNYESKGGKYQDQSGVTPAR